MRDTIFPMPAEELVAIDRAATALRERWAQFASASSPRTFDFTVKDVEAMDYMEYEGWAFPADSGALIVAEVVRRAAKLQWYMSYRGEWILTDKAGLGGVAVAPRARFHEYECGRATQFDNYGRLMAELALEFVWAEHGEGLLGLFPEGSEYFDQLQRKLDHIRPRGAQSN